MSKIMNFLKDEEGATMAEYALIVALVAVVSIGAWALLGTNVKSKMSDAATAIEGAGS